MANIKCQYNYNVEYILIFYLSFFFHLNTVPFIINTQLLRYVYTKLCSYMCIVIGYFRTAHSLNIILRIAPRCKMSQSPITSFVQCSLSLWYLVVASSFLLKFWQLFCSKYLLFRVLLLNACLLNVKYLRRLLFMFCSFKMF